MKSPECWWNDPASTFALLDYVSGGFPDLVEKPVSWTHRCLPLPSISKPFMRVSYPRRLMLLSIEAREPFDLCWLLGALRTR